MHIRTKCARGMDIGKRCSGGCDWKKRCPGYCDWPKGARVAAITPPGPRFQKVPVVSVLGPGPQYAYPGHLFRNRGHTGTFCRFRAFPNVHTPGTFFQSAYPGHLFQYAYPGHLLKGARGKRIGKKVPGVGASGRAFFQRCSWYAHWPGNRSHPGTF